MLQKAGALGNCLLKNLYQRLLKKSAVRNFNYSLRAHLKGFRVSREGRDGGIIILRKTREREKIIAPSELFHEVLNNFDYFYSLREDKNSAMLDLTPEKIILSDGSKKLIFSSPYEGEKVMALKNFDFFFNSKIFNPYNFPVIDFTRGVNFFGYVIKTTPAMLVEAEYALKAYNRYYSLKKGNVVFDIGAYTGTYAIWASEKVGREGKIYAFEPDRKNFQILKENVSKNKIENVIPVEKGIWSESSKIHFKESHGVDSQIIFQDETKTTNHNKTINVTSLKDFYLENNLKKIDFVKADIEGAEIELVKGALDFLKTHPVNFAIASYHVRNGRQTCHELEKLFKSIGYWVKTDNPMHLTTYAKPKKSVKKDRILY